MIRDSVWLLVELVALFFSVAFVIQLIQRRFGAERLRAWMGGHPVVAALKGIAIGFVTPFCTYSAIPMLVGLRQAGVPAAGYVAFISAVPVLDPVLFGALVLIVGAKAALVYATVAFFGAMTLALIAQRVGIEHLLKPISSYTDRSRQPAATGAEMTCTLTGGTHCSADVQEAWQGLRSEASVAARSAIVLLRSVAALLIAGVAIGLAIETAVSPATVARLTAGNGVFAIPIAAALGTPLYFDTSLFVPIADSLDSTGVNVPEFIILRRLATSRLVAMFFGYVFVVAIAGGLIAQALAV